MAGIFDTQTGELIRMASEDEYKHYLSEVAKLPDSDRVLWAIDGTPYGLPNQLIWMEELEDADML